MKIDMFCAGTKTIQCTTDRESCQDLGDFHGQFGGLMRLFDKYGSPSTAGDMAYIDYLFLGEYVDLGQLSLEMISVLLALKVKYPQDVHMVRGNPEAADIDALFGFTIECTERIVLFTISLAF
ncbi:hypothetical protein C5167_021018 [Papaver somniferum]|uniref:Calcineurin-like phosphoesterase domain-containing protein n=1 Tax=Papaver somniferum TaxID=3469 RepID=A0A4Y7IV77_PAPSO|nr:hypothetical protein C5167_021018 [Papaver somniferum]